MAGTNVTRASTTLLYNKRQYYFIFHPSATSFDTFVDFSAPPLSVKCGIQNTSNGFIVTSFHGNARNKKNYLKLDAVFFQFLDSSWADSFQGRSSFFSPVFEVRSRLDAFIIESLSTITERPPKYAAKSSTELATF